MELYEQPLSGGDGPGDDLGLTAPPFPVVLRVPSYLAAIEVPEPTPEPEPEPELSPALPRPAAGRSSPAPWGLAAVVVTLAGVCGLLLLFLRPWAPGRWIVPSGSAPLASPADALQLPPLKPSPAAAKPPSSVAAPKPGPATRPAPAARLDPHIIPLDEGGQP